MKPVIFQNIGEAYALGQRFLAAGLYDNFQIANLPTVFIQGMYWKIESVRGYLALNAIIPGRDANVTILTVEGVKPRKMAHEVSRLDRGVYRKFLDELKEHQRWLFREYGFQRLTALIRSDNHPSRVLANRMGYTLEGVKRCGFQLGRDNFDLCMYSILREEVLHGRSTQSHQRFVLHESVGEHDSVLAESADQLRHGRIGEETGGMGLDERRGFDAGRRGSETWRLRPESAAGESAETGHDLGSEEGLGGHGSGGDNGGRRGLRGSGLGREIPDAAGLLEHAECGHVPDRIQPKRDGELESMGELRFIGHGRIPGRSWQAGPWLRD